MGELSFFAFLYGILYWRTKIKVRQMEANEPASRLSRYHPGLLQLMQEGRTADVMAYVCGNDDSRCADAFWYLRARALVQQQSFHEARVAIEKAIALNTAYVEAYELRAQILDALGHDRLAADCRETVLRFTGRGLVTHTH